MERIIFILIIHFSWFVSARSQWGLDLTSYIYDSEYIVCGEIISADTTHLVSADPSKSQSVIVKMKVNSKLKGQISSDTIKIQYFPVDYWEHENPPELHVDSLYFGFMKYNSHFDYFEPYQYDYLCFSPIRPSQIPSCVLIVDGLLDENLDYCRYFKLLMEGVEADLILTYRSLAALLYDTSDLQVKFCIDTTTVDFLYTSFCRPNNTVLLSFTGNYYFNIVDSVLVNLISPRLQNIDESIDLYALDDKLAVYDYIEHLSFIKDNIENISKLDILYDLIFIGEHSEFTNLARELISIKRR